MAKFGHYTVSCGEEERVKSVLRENGRRVATMFENGEIEHKDYEQRFHSGQQLWDTHRSCIRSRYDATIREVGGDRQGRIDAYARAVYDAESYYRFCFDEEISDELLDEVIPVEWLV
jgi:hypothetical protein